MKITTIGVDLAKSVFQVHGADADGNAVLRKQLRRAQMLPFFANLEPCRVAMEACSGAHYWGRKLRAQGHDVMLIPPQYVKPYVKRNKNDAADAEAICEAATRPRMPTVPVKTAEQQAILSVHRARQGFVKARPRRPTKSAACSPSSALRFHKAFVRSHGARKRSSVTLATRCPAASGI